MGIALLVGSPHRREIRVAKRDEDDRAQRQQEEFEERRREAEERQKNMSRAVESELKPTKPWPKPKDQPDAGDE
jgi:hypothetical protein